MLYASVSQRFWEKPMSDQEPLIDVEDVDDTAKYIPNPAWKLFGDDIQEEE